MEARFEADFDEHDVPHRHGVGGLPDGKVESVEIEGVGVDRAIVVLFRLNDEPDALFGWRVPIWRRFAPVEGEMPEDGVELLPVYLDETISSSPRNTWASEPDERGICWIRLCFE
jgi:hypothetical protein